MSSTPSTSILPSVPPRRMLDWGPLRPGYCGETCLQMALLLNKGCYMSSEIVHRAINCEELLIGSGNDIRAAKVIGLDDYEVYESVSRKMKVPSTTTSRTGDDEKKQKKSSASSSSSSSLSFEDQQAENFIQQFIPKHIDQGHIVIAGFYGLYDHGKGDEDYDHIMPIVEYHRNDKTQRVDRIGYLDLWSTTEVRYLDDDEADGSLKLRSRKDCWKKTKSSNNNNNSKKSSSSSSSCLQHPLPWFLTLETIYAIAFTNKNNYHSHYPHHIHPLSIQVPYSMEPDCRRLFTTWYGKNGKHPFEDQLSLSIPMTKEKQQKYRDYQDWFEKQLRPEERDQFSQVLKASDEPTIVPIKLFLSNKKKNNNNSDTTTTKIVILKLQGILAMRIFEEILSSSSSSQLCKWKEDGICNVSVVSDDDVSLSSSSSSSSSPIVEVNVLCTEVAYFVGVNKEYYEQNLMKDERFQKMMKNYEEMVIKNKELLAKKKNTTKILNDLSSLSSLPISLPAGYMGVDISTEDDDDE